jgi:hypothetical protein
MAESNVIQRGRLVLDQIEPRQVGEKADAFAVRAVDAQAARMTWELIDFLDQYRQRADRQVEIIQETVVTPFDVHTREAVKKLHRQIVETLITDAINAGVRRPDSPEPVNETVIAPVVVFAGDSPSGPPSEPVAVASAVNEPFEPNMGPPQPGEM